MAETGASPDGGVRVRDIFASSSSSLSVEWDKGGDHSSNL